MDAAADDPREVARLQALAFGRDVPEEARAEALERLAEASRRTVPQPPPSNSHDSVEDHRPRRRARPRTLIVVVAVIALSAALGVWLVSRPVDSLAVFDRPPNASDRAAQERMQDLGFGPSPDDWSNARLLAEYGDVIVVGQREGSSVCLFTVEADRGSGGNCASDDVFASEGLSTPVRGEPRADGTRIDVTYQWGPQGGVVRTEHPKPSPPPPDPPLSIFDRDQDVNDAALLESLSLDEKQAASLRLVDARNGVRIAVYRPQSGRVCLVAVDSGSIAGDVAQNCGTDADVNGDGLTVDWPAEHWRFTWGPTSNLRIGSVS